MGKHMDELDLMVGKLKEREKGLFPETDRQNKFMKYEWDKLFLLGISLHTADIFLPAKPYLGFSKWMYLLYQEFFSQGDQEKALGLPVGFLNDWAKVNIPC